MTVNNATTGGKLQDVTVTIIEVARSGVSDITGISLIERIKPGTYHITCTKERFVTVTAIIEFELGKISSLAVAMMPL